MGFCVDWPSNITELAAPFHWPTVNGDPFGKPSYADKIVPLRTGILPEANLISHPNGSEDAVPWHIVRIDGHQGSCNPDAFAIDVCYTEDIELDGDR